MENTREGGSFRCRLRQTFMLCHSLEIQGVKYELPAVLAQCFIGPLVDWLGLAKNNDWHIFWLCSLLPKYNLAWDHWAWQIATKSLSLKLVSCAISGLFCTGLPCGCDTNYAVLQCGFILTKLWKSLWQHLRRQPRNIIDLVRQFSRTLSSNLLNGSRSKLTNKNDKPSRRHQLGINNYSLNQLGYFYKECLH